MLLDAFEVAEGLFWADAFTERHPGELLLQEFVIEISQRRAQRPNFFLDIGFEIPKGAIGTEEEEFILAGVIVIQHALRDMVTLTDLFHMDSIVGMGAEFFERRLIDQFENEFHDKKNLCLKEFVDGFVYKSNIALIDGIVCKLRVKIGVKMYCME